MRAFFICPLKYTNAIATLYFINKQKNIVMNQKIYEYFKKDRSFDEGVKLYNEFGSENSFKQILNIRGENENTKPQLSEELRVLCGIDKIELDFILSLPLEGENYVAPELEIVEIPEEIKKTIKLRIEFPFLRDPSCPDELKIMVADRITAYNMYVEAHADLFEATSDEELQIIAATVVENYLENQQIWNELNYYKENGKILGEYKIFEWKMREDEIRAMTPGDMVKLRDSLKNNIPRAKKLILDEPDHKNTSDRHISVKQKEKELKLVNQLLNIKDDVNQKVQPAKEKPAKPLKPVKKANAKKV